MKRLAGVVALFPLLLATSAHASFLDLDAEGNLTLTLGAEEFVFLSGTGNTIALSSSEAMARTGAGVGFDPIGGTAADDFVARGITKITIQGPSGARAFIEHEGNPLPEVSLNLGRVTFTKSLRTAGKPITIIGPINLQAGVAVDTTGGDSFPAGAPITFVSSNVGGFALNPHPLTLSAGTTGSVELHGAAWVSSLVVSGKSLTLLGNYGVPGNVLNVDFEDVLEGTTALQDVSFSTQGGDLSGGTFNANGSGVLSIDTEGPSSAGSVSFASVGQTTQFTSVYVRAGSLTLGGWRQGHRAGILRRLSGARRQAHHLRHGQDLDHLAQVSEHRRGARHGSVRITRARSHGNRAPRE